jgi:hypothetical protein
VRHVKDTNKKANFMYLRSGVASEYTIITVPKKCHNYKISHCFILLFQPREALAGQYLPINSSMIIVLFSALFSPDCYDCEISLYADILFSFGELGTLLHS